MAYIVKELQNSPPWDVDNPVETANHRSMPFLDWSAGKNDLCIWICI
jgi:hypothetical protein